MITLAVTYIILAVIYTAVWFAFLSVLCLVFDAMRGKKPEKPSVRLTIIIIMSIILGLISPIITFSILF